jgi:hypothetical protein
MAEYMSDDTEKNFNHTHPELLEGEVWLTNQFESDTWGVTIPHRIGTQAYTILGRPLSYGHPVFALKSDLEKSRQSGKGWYEDGDDDLSKL